MKIIYILFFFIVSLFANETMIEKNGCLECHQTRGAKLAPGWMGISKRANSVGDLVKAIKNGSKGKYPNPKFAGIQMPSFKNIKAEELDSMALWIYNLSR